MTFTDSHASFTGASVTSNGVFGNILTIKPAFKKAIFLTIKNLMVLFGTEKNINKLQTT